MTSIQAEVVREVFGHADTRSLLLFLDDQEEACRYSHVRKELGIHPQQFQRSVERLEHHGMVGRILRGEPDAAGRRAVFLEATAGGHFWADHWRRFEREVKEDAAQVANPEDLLSGAVA